MMGGFTEDSIDSKLECRKQQTSQGDKHHNICSLSQILFNYEQSKTAPLYPTYGIVSI